MSDTALAARNTIDSSTLARRFYVLTASACALFREWRLRRRSRAQLASYSFAERSDFGYAAEIDAEIEKPFWRK